MLTIGDFSRLSRITPRMLRHYDALGLLRPEEVGDNGYRYYRQEQLSDLMRIQWLKGYGFSLGEIGPLLELEDSQLLPPLRQRRLELCRELDRQQGLIHQIEADILRMEGRPMPEEAYHVTVMPDPEQTVFGIRRTTPVAKFHDLFQELRREIAQRGLKQTGPIQMLYHDEEFNPKRSDVEAQMVVAQEGPDVRVRPACLCAAVQHRGPYENLHLAYEALVRAWLGGAHRDRMCGPR